jgi:hypothetical protein
MVSTGWKACATKPWVEANSGNFSIAKFFTREPPQSWKKCHSERSEESRIFNRLRSFTLYENSFKQSVFDAAPVASGKLRGVN